MRYESLRDSLRILFHFYSSAVTLRIILFRLLSSAEGFLSLDNNNNSNNKLALFFQVCSDEMYWIVYKTSEQNAAYQ